MDVFTVILAFSRITAFLFMIPFLNGRYIQTLAKVSIALALSFASIGQMPELQFESLPQMTMAVLIQIAIGITMGYIISLVMAAAAMAGGIMDMDIGFSMVNMLDPSTNTNSSVLQTLFNNFYYVIFITLGGIPSLMSGIVASMKFVSPSFFIGNHDFMDYVLAVFLYMLTAAVQISLPMIGAMFILNITMLVIGKSSPQFNIFMNGIGIKIAVGVLLICMILPFVGQVFTSMNEVMFDKFNETMLYLFQSKGGGANG